MIIRLFPLRCGGGGLREYLPSIDGWMMTVTVTIYKAEAEATESKRTDADATRPDAKPFRSVFVRANSEHMSKVMRLAKG